MRTDRREKLEEMPFSVKDWLAETIHWACAERGAYIQLLAFQWVNGNVPPDVSQLARITGLTESEFERAWLIVGGKFDAADGGLFHKRLEDSRKRELRLHGARTLGATLSNVKRRAKKNALPDAERDALRDAQGDALRDAEHDAPGTPGAAASSLPSSPASPSVSFSLINPLPSTPPSSPSSLPSHIRLPVEKTQSVRRAKAKSVSRETFDEGFLSFKLAYPLRDGGQAWKAAMKVWHGRIAAGYTAEQIIAGAERYALWVKARGSERTEYVMHAKTFLGPENYFLQDWEVLASGPEDERWTPPSDDAMDPP